MPWRAEPGEHADPYHVWLSEIMLQQTTVAAVGPYFLRFLERWPTVTALAAADLDEVLTEWAGLGYYARARNLHRCAGVVVQHHAGKFPESESQLLDLPGIGAYTAAAISAIAFDAPATVLDGNVERVIARLDAVTDPLPGVKERLRRHAAALTPQARPGDHAQAMMDLGATICTPRKPKCLTCPWMGECRARELGIAEELPRKTPKKPRPIRRAAAYWCLDADGRVLVRRRPEKGLLGGMIEVPSDAWIEDAAEPKLPGDGAPGPMDWRRLPGLVRHTFTHFHLELTVFAGRMETDPPGDLFWHPVDKLGEIALPSVMVKVARHASKHV